MKLKEFLDMYDNWNGKLRINDEENAMPIVEYNHAYKFAFDGEAKEYEYLKEYNVIAFGFYEETLCVRVAKPTPKTETKPKNIYEAAMDELFS